MGTVQLLSALIRGLHESTASGVVIGGLLDLTVICMAGWQLRSRTRRISLQPASGFSEREARLSSALRRLSTSETPAARAPVNDRREAPLDSRHLLDCIPGMMFETTADGLPEYVNQPLLAPALVWRATPDGKIDYMNPRLVAYTGGTPETFRKIGWPDLIHPEDRELAKKELNRCIVSGSSYAATYRMRDTHGVYRWFEVRAEPLHNAEGTLDHWYGVLVDINGRRQLEAELLETQQRLAKASHIAAIAELSASIAHEINQPLSALAANADACERWLSIDPPNIERARRSLGSIQRDIAGADSIVRRMRALFKQDPPIKVPLNINELITDVHDLLLEETTKRGSTLVLDLATPIPMTLADGIQIQQVLVNLIHNALDAMVGADRSAGALVIRSHQDGSSLVVEVLDNGSGFHDADRLFDPFFTTKADGMGMGLAICYSIIQAHSGRIWAEPGTPVGSVFSFSIPILM